MADILGITTKPSTKTQILYWATLSYTQLQKYLTMLRDFGMISELIQKGGNDKPVITERGKQFLADLPTRFGTIAQGQHSVWT
jgi:predicted transcriptional regulator